MDNKKKYLLYAIALFSALFTTLLVSGYVNNKVEQAKSEVKTEVKTVTIVEKPEVKSIVVAARDVYRGELIEVDDITMLSVPVDALTVKGLFDDPQLVVGKVLNQDVYAGEWVIDRKIADEGSGVISGITGLLDEDERAVRIALDRISGLAGVLKPNDYVDVISVFKSADGKRRISRTILENVEVLMVGDYQGGRNIEEGEGYAAANDVVLRLNFRDVEHLTLAQSIGRTTLSLRNPADTKLNDSNGINIQTIEVSDAQRASRRQTAPKKQRQTIQILQGNQVQEVLDR